jgi:hypothetical protein
VTRGVHNNGSVKMISQVTADRRNCAADFDIRGSFLCAQSSSGIYEAFRAWLNGQSAEIRESPTILDAYQKP